MATSNISIHHEKRREEKEKTYFKRRAETEVTMARHLHSLVISACWVVTMTMLWL
jgi:hypothetical protein